MYVTGTLPSFQTSAPFVGTLLGLSVVSARLGSGPEIEIALCISAVSVTSLLTNHV